ncbi:MAG: cation:proton antiporter [Ruminococcaceae bacterium]|nr:cation:proton antiporter [Oscillospiraceae bacterium]
MSLTQILLSLSIALFAGLMLSRLAKILKLPAVTAYLVAGILVGPYCLGLIGVPGLGFNNMGQVEAFSILCDIALGFIAFSIGNEFRLSELKHTGKQATVIGILQAVVTTLLVDGVLIALHFMMPDKLSLSAAIVLGAVASATAPAATLMVVRQYKAKGPLTSTLLPVVALDDAVGLVLFAVSFGVANAISAGKVSILSIVLEPILEVVLSLILGTVMGFIFTFCERFFHSRSKRLSMSVAFVLLTVALSNMSFHIGQVHVAFSPLLSCMMLGTIFCNVCDFSEELMDRLDRWTGPLFILFFVLSGAELELSVFTDWAIVVIGLLYILARCAGKYGGAFGSAKMMHCDDNIVKYLGITLFPQAGVALGMAMKAQNLADGGAIVAQITLFAVLIYEIVGPTLTKISLMRAGEIKPEGKTSARKTDAEMLAAAPNAATNISQKTPSKKETKVGAGK